MYSQEQLDAFVEDVQAGKPYTHIARDTGININTLFRWRRELGLPKRGRGAPKGKRVRHSDGEVR